MTNYQLEQIKKIRLTSIARHLDTCLDCNYTAKFMYKQGDRMLCPRCDSDIIEDYKERLDN